MSAYRGLFVKPESPAEERERLYRHLQSTSLQNAVGMSNTKFNVWRSERDRILRRIELLDRATGRLP